MICSSTYLPVISAGDVIGDIGQTGDSGGSIGSIAINARESGMDLLFNEDLCTQQQNNAF